MKNFGLLVLSAIMLLAVSCRDNPQEVFRTVENGDGPLLGYSPASGIALIQSEGYYFKDLNRNGRLDTYEDWRLDPDERALDLAARLSIEEIAGLMLHSTPQAVPDINSNYGGKQFYESPAAAWEMTDRQEKFLREDNLRHILMSVISGAEDAARWNNRLQAFAESLGHGIPVGIASYPRNSAKAVGLAGIEYNEGAGGEISVWPEGLAIAATFRPGTAGLFAQTASEEYRALGITTVLGPQADLGTDPRWRRIASGFGEHPVMAADITRAYIDGFQASGADDRWGPQSVTTMLRHWPGPGTGEGGRDAHYAYGKFGVYPGDNFQMQLTPFTDGAFALSHGTDMASGVMPSYAICYGQSSDSTNNGTPYSRYMITDLLRAECGYDGVICADRGVTRDEGVTPDIFAGKPWGAEQSTESERFLSAIMAGVDQFAGCNDIAPILEAYEMGVQEYGGQVMRGRFEQSAVRILRNLFRVGLFENPYVDAGEAGRIVGNPVSMTGGYTAQMQSIVMLKNSGSLIPIKSRKKVYIPQSFYRATKGWAGRGGTEERWEDPVEGHILDRYYEAVRDPHEADFAIVFVNSPDSGGGYDINDRTAGGNGYVPISLQYRPYTADSARVHSIAAGDPVIDPLIENRSYWEKTVTTSNEKELDVILDTRWKMQDKPVIVVVNISRPMVFSEFETRVDAIVARFGVTEQAVLEIISGRFEPKGLLPLQMPADMVTVELQDEDLPMDMQCHTDSEGNVYDFGFGLDWSGVIQDERTEKYGKINR